MLSIILNLQNIIISKGEVNLIDIKNKNKILIIIFWLIYIIYNFNEWKHIESK